MSNLDNKNDRINWTSKHAIRTTNISDIQTPLKSNDVIETPKRSITRGSESNFERTRIDHSNRQSSPSNVHFDRVVEKSKKETLQFKQPIESLKKYQMDNTKNLIHISPSSVLYHPNNNETIFKKKLKVKSFHRSHHLSKILISENVHGCFHSTTKINEEINHPPNVLRKASVRFYAQDRPKDPVAKTLLSSCIHTFFKPVNNF